MFCHLRSGNSKFSVLYCRAHHINQLIRVTQVEVDSSEEGRITGANKQLLDQRVHEMLSEDVEAPPPPYSPPEGKASSLSPSSLSGDNILTAPGQT